MIKSVEIKNFQSHKHTKLELSPGVNVIVGSSDSGKTAIIRALRWLIWNRPSGSEFRSTWGGDTEIKVELEAGFITRGKSKEDTYIAKMKGMMSEMVYKAFRTDVPEEIQKILNVTEINLQSQHDAPFLLSDSPGEVAQHFNKIAHLDKIDSGLQNIQSTIRELERDIKYKTEDIEQKKEELKKFDHLEKFEAEVEVLEQMDKMLTAKRNALKELESLCVGLDNVNGEIKEYDHILSLEKQVNTIDKQITLVGEKEVELLKLERLIDGIKRVSNNISKGESQIPILKKQFDKEMGNTCILCGQSIKHNNGNK